MKDFVSKLLGSAPVAYTNTAARSLPMFGGGSNQTGQMDAYGRVSRLFAIVNGLSSDVSRIKWKLWRKSASGHEEDRQEVTRHLALEIWNKPNPFMTQQEFIEAIQQHIDLTGEGWWLVGRDSRATFPMELWPVRPDKMEPVPSAQNFIEGYIYRSPDGTLVPFNRDEVIFQRMPNPLDMYRGLGPVQSVLTNADAVKYSAEWNRNFYLNSAEPGGIIKVPTHLSDTEFRKMRERWNEQHRGVANAHRVAILEEGEWVDRKYTIRDQQFTELTTLNNEQIREAFRYPLPMLGTVENSNRANMDAASTQYAEYCLVPRLERWKQALNNDFLPLFGTTGQGVEFDFEDPVPENRELEATLLNSKAEAAAKLIGAGLNIAGVLQAVGLPDIPVGAGPVNTGGDM